MIDIAIIDKLVHNKLVNHGKILFDRNILNYRFRDIKYMRLRKNKQTKRCDRNCHNCCMKNRECYRVNYYHKGYFFQRDNYYYQINSNDDIILCIDCLNMFKKFQHINKYDFYGHYTTFTINNYIYSANIYKLKQYEWRYYIINKNTIVQFEQTYLYPTISRKATTDMKANTEAFYRLNTGYLILKELTINDIAMTIAKIYIRLIKWRR